MLTCQAVNAAGLVPITVTMTTSLLTYAGNKKLPQLLQQWTAH